MADPYVYPGTDVLRNLAGVRYADTLADHEAQASTLRLAQLAALRLKGAYGASPPPGVPSVYLPGHLLLGG